MHRRAAVQRFRVAGDEMTQEDTMFESRRLLWTVLVAVVAAGCSSARVLATERLPDATLEGVTPAAFSAACAAFSDAIGWRVERADSSAVIVETPRDPVRSGSDATTWIRVRVDLSSTAAGDCTLSCIISELADGDVGEARAMKPDDRVGGLVRAAAAQARGENGR
jgi:hypothetical protein